MREEGRGKREGVEREGISVQNGRSCVITPEHKHSLFIHHSRHSKAPTMCSLPSQHQVGVLLSQNLGSQQEEAGSKQVCKTRWLVGRAVGSRSEVVWPRKWRKSRKSQKSQESFSPAFAFSQLAAGRVLMMQGKRNQGRNKTPLPQPDPRGRGIMDVSSIERVLPLYVSRSVLLSCTV